MSPLSSCRSITIAMIVLQSCSLIFDITHAFNTPSFIAGTGIQQTQTLSSFLSAATSARGTSFLCAKKKKGTKSVKGFGQVAPAKESSSVPESFYDENTPEEKSDDGFVLESIGGKTRPDIKVDPNLPTEERTTQILREKYGLVSFEEEQGDMKIEEKKKEARERKKKMERLANLDDESIDVFTLLPKEFISAIDFVLKGGLTVSTIVFVSMGVAVTVEAWSKATGNELNADLDSFIVNTVEPNFTPMLLVLLGFSVSLGVFAAAQLGSSSSQYKE